jgi:hypothetical protein
LRRKTNVERFHAAVDLIYTYEYHIGEAGKSQPAECHGLRTKLHGNRKVF